MVNSVYIHTPFCKQKCKYCSFVSFVNQEKKRDYVDALLIEIDSFYNGELLKTLYFGGGTPSLLETSLIEKIIEKFNLSSDCEVTFEINPDDADSDYVKKIYDVGVNRLSFGAQTFCNDTLKLIGRRHTSEQTLQAVILAQEAGFENINLDLIYGLPNQTPSKIKKDLEIITNLGIKHISTYGLKIEEESYWGKFPPENIPDDDSQADMYLLINDQLESKGYHRYEISNFALEGFESKHNLNYWNNSEYYGFGVAAHGYIDNIRYSNFCTLQEYLNNPIARAEEHKQSDAEKLEEEIFLGFRKSSGINISNIKRKFGIDFETKYEKILCKYMPEYIVKTMDGYRLTTDGVLLSNNILAEFIE